MGNVVVVNHPLIQHKVGLLRDKETKSSDFADLVEEISTLMCYEAMRNLELEDIEVETPICKTTAKQLSGKKLAIVPILRAGLAMVDGIKKCIPRSRIGHIGMYRNPVTHRPIRYLVKLPPNCDEREVFLVDPMLATGGSIVMGLDILKAAGCRSIHVMSIIAAPEGVEVVQATHPDVDLYVAAIDQCLNENMYIVPGLGDAGDRIFGTK